MRLRYFLSGLFLPVVYAVTASAHTGPGGAPPLADIVRSRSIDVALWAGGIALGLMLIAMWRKNASEETKKLLFALIVMCIVGSTGYFIWSTVILNLKSEANGPVHWHTDFQIYACGEKLPPPNPKGKLTNKTGTPVLHQHADDRLHVEGVVIEPSEVELDRFFEVQGGTLSENAFRVPTGDTVVTYLNGDYCPNGAQGKWNVFLWRVDEATMTATQTKLTDYVHYVPAPHELPPLIDCLIFEFGPETAYTDRLCNFHQIAVNDGELKIAVPAKSEPGSASSSEIDTSSWQTYRNEKYGYEFQYPEGWAPSIDPILTNAGRFNLVFLESSCELAHGVGPICPGSIFVDEAYAPRRDQYNNFSDFSRAYYSESSDDQIVVMQKQFAGYEAVFTENIKGMSEWPRKTILIDFYPEPIVIQYFAYSVGTSSPEQVDRDFEHILSTFKFNK